MIRRDCSQPLTPLLSFDNLLVLHRGRTAYYGPAASMTAYFASNKIVFPDQHNPAQAA